MKYFNKHAFLGRLAIFHPKAKPLTGVASKIRGSLNTSLGSKGPKRVMTADVQDFLTGKPKIRGKGKLPGDVNKGNNLKALYTASDDFEIAGAGVTSRLKAMNKTEKALTRNPELSKQYQKALYARFRPVTQ